MSEVHKLRSEYKGEFLDVTNVDPSPFAQFKTWFETALSEKVQEPNAMCLSTVDEKRILISLKINYGGVILGVGIPLMLKMMRHKDFISRLKSATPPRIPLS